MQAPEGVAEMAHTFTNPLIHGLFSPKDRQAMIRPEMREDLAQQAEHHRRRTFQEEVTALLKKHGMEFDPRFVV